jgi:hypothetical protein
LRQTSATGVPASARTCEAIHNGWGKNDLKDAQVILHLLCTGLTQRCHDPLLHGLNDLQELSKTHEAISKAKTEVLHRLLIHYLRLYFPGIERFRHNSCSEWFFSFLDYFPRRPASPRLARCWSAVLTRRLSTCGISTGTQDLEEAIRACTAANDADPEPFVWTKSAEAILASIGRYCQRISQLRPLEAVG